MPAHSTSLVGRTAELDALSDAMASSRLVTLTGPGGAGKTRLAIELATRAELPDGAWFVDLTSRRDARDVATAVLEVIVGDDRAREDPDTAIGRAIRGKRMLVVLDNCEHVLAAAASLASALLESAPDVRVVATSRAALGVAGELVWEVPPLASPPSGTPPEAVADFDAARLLGERLAAARGGRAPGDTEWDGIGRLCRSLDGLPLAIELVAAQAATLPLATLADMTERGALDAVATTSAAGHHRSLATCIDWSVDLLDPERRHLLQLVCLLPGPFSVGAASAVAGETDEDRTMAALAHLARQSLLQPVRADSARFRVLETIRHALRPTVDPVTADDALRRLAAWAADWVESVEPTFRGPEAAEVLEELDSQREVLNAALEHGLASADPTNAVRIAASISALWSYRGHLREGQRWLDRAIAVAESVAVPLRIRLLVAAGSHQMAVGDIDAFQRHVTAALTLARDGAGEADALRVLLWAGHASTLQGDLATAGTLYDEALQLAEHAGDRSSTASALAGLGDVAAARGDLDAAATLHLRALAAFRAAGDAHGEGQALLNVGEVERRAGRNADALRTFHEAVRVFERINDRSCIAASNEGLARVAVDRHAWEEAEVLYRTAIESRRELGQSQAQIRSLIALAGVLAERGRAQDAAAALGAAGHDFDDLAYRLRAELGDRGYLAAWAEGSTRRVTPPV